MLTSMRKFLKEKGQGLTEYVLILAFVAGVAYLMFANTGLKHMCKETDSCSLGELIGLIALLIKILQTIHLLITDILSLVNFRNTGEYILLAGLDVEVLTRQYIIVSYALIDRAFLMNWNEAYFTILLGNSNRTTFPDIIIGFQLSVVVITFRQEALEHTVILCEFSKRLRL